MKKSVYRKAAEWLFENGYGLSPGCCLALRTVGGDYNDPLFKEWLMPPNDTKGWWMSDDDLTRNEVKERRILALLLMEQIALASRKAKR